MLGIPEFFRLVDLHAENFQVGGCKFSCLRIYPTKWHYCATGLAVRLLADGISPEGSKTTHHPISDTVVVFNDVLGRAFDGLLDIMLFLPILGVERLHLD